MKKNKYINMNVVQVDYGQGWEDVCQSESYREAKDDLKAYRENSPEYKSRLISRRVLNEEGDQNA